MKTSAEELESQAIKAATENDWEAALKTNLALLKLQPQNTPALNRLARAYLETGKKTLAKKTYQKVLKIDQYNLIATKNLQKLTLPGKKHPTPLAGNNQRISSLFLEEAGKTKVVSLIRLGSPTALSNLHPGKEVQLVPKKRSISIEDDKTYLGALPDDLSFRLLKLITGGNQYQAWVKSIAKKSLQVFIREIHRGQRYQNTPTFPPSGTDYIPYLPPEKIHEERPEMTPTGEEES